MSIFKEKDDLISKVFLDESDGTGSDEDEDHGREPVDDNSTTIEETPDSIKSNNSVRLTKRIKLDQVDHSIIEDVITLEDVVDSAPSPNKGSSIECINLDCDDSGDRDRHPKRLSARPRRRNNKPKKQENQIITISDDDLSDVAEVEPRTAQCSQDVSITSLDNEDYDFNLKVTISGTYKQFSTTYQTTLRQALKEYLSELKSLNKTIVVTNQSIPVSLDESPSTLRLTPGTILKAIEVLAESGDIGDCNNVIDPDTMTLKLQDGHRKHLKEFQIKRDQPIASLIPKYAKEFDLDAKDIRLMFDGDVIDDELTPEDLELEDAWVIDVIVKS